MPHPYSSYDTTSTFLFDLFKCLKLLTGQQLLQQKNIYIHVKIHLRCDSVIFKNISGAQLKLSDPDPSPDPGHSLSDLRPGSQM